MLSAPPARALQLKIRRGIPTYRNVQHRTETYLPLNNVPKRTRNFRAYVVVSSSMNLTLFGMFSSIIKMDKKQIIER
jgi:hypothetical protein